MSTGDGSEAIQRGLSRLGIADKDVLRLPVQRGQTGAVVFLFNPMDKEYYKRSAETGAAALMKSWPIAGAWTMPERLIGFYYRDGSIRQDVGSEITATASGIEIPVFVLIYRSTVPMVGRKKLAINARKHHDGRIIVGGVR